MLLMGLMIQGGYEEKRKPFANTVMVRIYNEKARMVG